MFHEPCWKRSNQKQMPPRKRSTGSRPVRNRGSGGKGGGKEKDAIVRKICKISFLPIFGINPLSLSRDIFLLFYSKRDGIKIQRSAKMEKKYQRGKEIESGVQKRPTVPSFRNLSRATALPDHRELLLFFPSLFSTPPR